MSDLAPHQVTHLDRRESDGAVSVGSIKIREVLRPGGPEEGFDDKLRLRLARGRTVNAELSEDSPDPGESNGVGFKALAVLEAKIIVCKVSQPNRPDLREHRCQPHRPRGCCHRLQRGSHCLGLFASQGLRDYPDQDSGEPTLI